LGPAGLDESSHDAGPVVNAEMLVAMLEKHGIAATQEFTEPELPDDGDLNRMAKVLVPEADYERAHSCFTRSGRTSCNNCAERREKFNSSANRYPKSVLDRLRAKPSSPRTSAMVCALLCWSSQIFPRRCPAQSDGRR